MEEFSPWDVQRRVLDFQEDMVAFLQDMIKIPSESGQEGR